MTLSLRQSDRQTKASCKGNKMSQWCDLLEIFTEKASGAEITHSAEGDSQRKQFSIEWVRGISGLR